MIFEGSLSPVYIGLSLSVLFLGVIGIKSWFQMLNETQVNKKLTIRSPTMVAEEMERFQEIVYKSIQLKNDIVESPTSFITISKILDICEDCLRNGGKLIFMGNGGSAADSSHLATEMLIRLRSHVERDSYPAIALTLDPTMLTACGNDYGFDKIFERPLRGIGKSGDVLFALTTSGKSKNIIMALQAAIEMNIATVGFLGGDGGDAFPFCDEALIVPSYETARIQECHMMLGHTILELLENRLINS